MHPVYKSFLIIYFFLFSLLFLSATQDETKYRWVTAEIGLRIRQSPRLNGKKIGVIPFKTRVILLEEQDKTTTIAGATGRWSKVNWSGTIGWVFGGFLQANPLEEISSYNFIFDYFTVDNKDELVKKELDNVFAYDPVKESIVPIPNSSFFVEATKHLKYIFLPKINMFAANCDLKTYLVDMEGNYRLLFENEDYNEIKKVTTSPDGQYILYQFITGQMYAYDIKSRETFVLSGTHPENSDFLLNSYNDYFYSEYNDKSDEYQIYLLKDNTEEKEIIYSSKKIIILEAARDRDTLYFTLRNQDKEYTLYKFDIKAKKEERVFSTQFEFTSYKFNLSKSGKYFAYYINDKIYIYETDSKELYITLTDVPDIPFKMIWSEDDYLFYPSDLSQNSSISVLKLATKETKLVDKKEPLYFYHPGCPSLYIKENSQYYDKGHIIVGAQGAKNEKTETIYLASETIVNGQVRIKIEEKIASEVSMINRVILKIGDKEYFSEDNISELNKIDLQYINLKWKESLELTFNIDTLPLENENISLMITGYYYRK